jgi:hypothetical protein
LAADKEILASVKPGKPPADCPVLGTWRLRTYVRERLSDGQRHNQFGEAPNGYIGYAPDGRMYAIFTRRDRVAPREVVPTDEEGMQLLGTMLAYAGTFSLGENVVVHHIDTSWNQAWTGTDQIRHFVLEGDTLTITTAAYKSYLDGTMGRSILVWSKVQCWRILRLREDCDERFIWNPGIACAGYRRLKWSWKIFCDPSCGARRARDRRSAPR